MVAADPSTVELLKLAASAGLGLFAGLIVQWWKSARDERRALSDEICRTARGAIETAADYWLTLESTRLPSLEARLLGQQVELNAIIQDTFISELSFDHRVMVREQLKKFIKAATGDDFGSRGDIPKIELAKAVHMSGGELINSVRLSIKHRNSLLGTLTPRLGR